MFTNQIWELGVKLLPKLVEKRAKTSFPSRETFSVTICTSHNEEILSSSDSSYTSLFTYLTKHPLPNSLG